ncbi:MAG: hypothetical protein PHW47_06315 [Lachnospira sp.]|nr:hypothetical protein [Lachnospira sp.]
MEQELTMQELIALMNDSDGELLIHVEFGEEADTDGEKTGSTE